MSICDVPVISTVCQTPDETAGTLITAPFDWLASAMGAAASWMFHSVWALFDSTTLVNLTNPGYIGVYNLIFGVAVFVMVIFFCLQLITGILRRDHAALGRAGLGLAKSVLGSFLVLSLMVTLLQVVDQLCIGIIHATGTTLTQMGSKFGVLVAGLTTITITAPGAGAIITIFLSFLAITAAGIVWFSLLIRKTLILVAVVMAPIALSGASWDATRGWFGKWASFVLALVFSKLVIVIVFLVAITQVNAPIDTGLSSIADPVAGIVLMFIAAFAPYMVYKFIAFVGFDMHHVMSAEQESKQAMSRPIPTLHNPAGGGPKKVLDSITNPGSKSGSRTGAPPPNSAPSESGSTVPAAGTSSGTAAGSAGNTAGAGTGTGASAAAGTGAGTGAGAAAGPIGIAAVAAAQLATGAAEAGPKLGGALGQTAQRHTSASQQTQTPPPPPAPPGRSAAPPRQSGSGSGSRTSPSPPPPSPAGPTKTL